MRPAAHKGHRKGTLDLLQAAQLRQPETIPSRGPWLASGLCCPAGSMLTMTSCCASHLRSATYGFAVEPSNPAMGGKREGPQFTRCVCSYVPSPEPRWTGRLHMAVASPPVLAFANSAVARHPQDHARWFSRGSCNEADRVRLRYGPHDC